MRVQHLRPYRVARIARTVLTSLPPYLWLLARERVRRPAPDAAWERVHERTAVRVDRMVERLGGIPTKFAQIAAARQDLFPEPYVRRLRRYHDDVPPRAFARLRPQIEAGLGLPLEDVFWEIEDAALAAASIAQVHRGRLRDGRRVAVKVQYPEIARIASVDLSTARIVSRLLTWLTGSDFRSFVREITRFVALELDFVREAESTERLGRELAAEDRVRVPAVHRELCGPGLLVLEYLEGVPICDVDGLRRAGHDPADVARRVARLYATMIFQQGFFHGDPHPGNLLVLPDGSIGLLDFGLCKELPPGFARKAATLIVRGVEGDAPGVLAAAADLGFQVEGVDPQAGLALVALLMGRSAETSALLPALFQANPLKSIPSDIALVVRTLVLLNGLSHTLAPGSHLVQAELATCLMPLLASTQRPQPSAPSPLEVSDLAS